MLRDTWRTIRLLRSALAASYWPPERLRGHQEERLRALLQHAYENVPLYRALYDEHGFRPEQFGGLADLARIPVLRKERLKDVGPEQLVSRGVDPSGCATVATSGSTGMPLRIYLGPEEVVWQRVVAWRILFEHGFRWTDRTLEIRKTSGPRFFVQRLGIAPKEWLSILDSPERWVNRLVQQRHQVVVAGAGILRALAEAACRLGVEPPRPRIVVSDSETLMPETRRAVARFLGTDPIDVYGLVELSNFVWQCEEREGFHTSADSHLVEIVGPPGEPGHIIATDLGMKTMPMIRYDTGDMGEAATEPCRCGRTLPVLRRIYGRAVDSVVLPEGRRLFWPFFHEVLGAQRGIRQWRVVQEQPARLRLQLVLDASNSDLVRHVREEIERALPAEMELVIEPVGSIDTPPGEKPRVIVPLQKATPEGHGE